MVEQEGGDERDVPVCARACNPRISTSLRMHVYIDLINFISNALHRMHTLTPHAELEDIWCIPFHEHNVLAALHTTLMEAKTVKNVTAPSHAEGENCPPVEIFRQLTRDNGNRHNTAWWTCGWGRQPSRRRFTASSLSIFWECSLILASSASPHLAPSAHSPPVDSGDSRHLMRNVARRTAGHTCATS